MNIVALVAAAGASTRMGRSKALLPWDDRQSFLERMLRVLDRAGIESVVLTLPSALAPPELLRVLSLVPDHERIVTANAYPAQGLSGSVRTALEASVGARALLVWPIDCPFADAALVQTLMECVGRGAPAALPVVDRQRGHPVLFSSATFELLADADAIGGPRGVVHALGDEVQEVPWSDPRVAHDVDTLEDYRNLFGRDP